MNKQEAICKDLMLQIKHHMLDKGIRQIDIANKVGLSHQSISNLLNARSPNMTLNTLYMLANAIGCNLEIKLIDKKEKENVSDKI